MNTVQLINTRKWLLIPMFAAFAFLLALPHEEKKLQFRVASPACAESLELRVLARDLSLTSKVSRFEFTRYTHHICIITTTT